MEAQPNSVGLPRVVLPSEWPDEPKPGAPRCHRGEGALNNRALIVGFAVPCEVKSPLLFLYKLDLFGHDLYYHPFHKIQNASVKRSYFPQVKFWIISLLILHYIVESTKIG